MKVRRRKSQKGKPKSEPMRLQAEEFLRMTRRDVTEKPVEDMQRLVHELQVHQVELDMQNEELRETQAALEAARDEYEALYELAPVGFLLLNHEGAILKANSRAALLFGVERRTLVRRVLTDFLAPGDRDRFRQHLASVFAEPGIARSCELRLNPDKGHWRGVHVESVAAHGDDEGNPKYCQIGLLDITPRMRLDAALQEKEAQLAAIIGSAMDAIISVDAAQRVILFNPAAERLFRWTAAEMIGKPLQRLIPERYRQGHHRQFGLFAAGAHSGEPDRPIAIMGLRKDGEEFYAEASISHVKVGDQRLFTVILRDVTERRQYEETLRLSQRVIDSSPDLIAIVGRDYVYQRVNPAYERMFGIAKENIVGRTILDLLGAEQFEQIIKPQVDQSLAGVLVAFTAWLTLGRSRRFLSVSYTPLMNREGVEGVIVTARDVTELKLAQQALELSEERFRAFSDHTPTVKFLKDERGRYLYVNARVERAFNRPIADWLGKTDEDLFPSEIARRLRGSDRAALERDEPIEVEETVPDASGEPRDWLVFKFPMTLREGRKAVGGVALDVTDRKRVERELDQQRAALERSEAELRMLSTRLITAQEEERRRIARDLHDDISQRLAVLVMELDLLARQQPLLPELFADRLASIGSMVTRLAEDIHNLAYELHPSLLDHAGLEAAVRDLVDSFGKRTRLAVVMTARHLPARYDRDVALCLYRIVQECLHNVGRHARASTVMVRLIGTRHGVGALIVDDGDGFDPERAMMAGGLGLLSMQERARLLNGRLRVLSRPGRGTSVRVWIPLSAKAGGKGAASHDTGGWEAP